MVSEKILNKRRKIMGITPISINKVLFSIQDRISCLEELLTPVQKKKYEQMLLGEVVVEKKEISSVKIEPVPISVQTLSVSTTSTVPKDVVSVEEATSWEP